LRKTGNPPKRKLHLLDRDGWSPDLTKVSSMTKEDYDSEVADLFHSARCFHRFRLASDWEVKDARAEAVDSDSSVSLSSLTDSSEKVFLPGLTEGEESHLPVQNSRDEGKLTAAAWGADGLLLTFQFP